jgi:hypothetical protein
MIRRASDTIARVGFFLYDGTVRCPLRIVRTDFRPGSGDHEDPPEIADDQSGLRFRVDLTAAGDPNKWRVGGGYFRTQAAAERHLKETSRTFTGRTNGPAIGIGSELDSTLRIDKVESTHRDHRNRSIMVTGIAESDRSCGV